MPKPASQSRNPPRRRYAVVYDIDGPRVRLGVLWFLAEVAALTLGRFALALLYAAVAAVAGFQASAAWRARGKRPDRIVPGAAAGVFALAGAFGVAYMGLASLVLAAAAIGVAAGQGGRRDSVVVNAGYTIQSSLFFGLAAGSVLLTARYGYGAAVALVLIAAAYDAGDFLVGTGANNPYEGPLAGFAAVAVTTFFVSVLNVRPLEFPDGLFYALLAGAACPLGQLLASALLPSPETRANAVRRLDSLLVLAPLWALVVGIALR